MKLKLPFFRNGIKILSLTVFLFVLLSGTISNAQTITNNTQGTNNGFFYSFWNDNTSGSASMTLGAAGNYSTTWSNIGNFTAGKGWATGSPNRVICFSGSFNGGNNGYIAIYGWTKNSLIEYYVVENHGSWTPPGGTSLGTLTSDGGTYNIYKMQRVNAPNITGTNQTFDQYWSVRTTTRSSGTVTFANHVAAWASHGMPMGSTWDYQILETEGYQSSGNSNVTVSECTSCATAAPTATTSYTYEVGATATQLTATGTALKWYADNTTTTTLPGAPTPSTTTTGTTKYYVSQTLNGCEGPRTEITVNVIQTYKIYKVSTPITIDGTAESSWTNASVLPAGASKLLSGTVTNSTDLSGNFKALWDDTYLYVLADVTDDVKVNDSQNVYDDDAIEVYVDINNDKATTYGANDVQYSFGWNDGTTVVTLPTGRSTTNISYVAVARTGGYVVEARIPWTTLQGTPAIGQLVGVDFMINDDDDGGTRDGKLSWNASTDDAWENPSLFGTAILQGTLPCTTPAAPTVVTPVTYCQNATATALTATGTSLLWYTTATGGSGSSTAIIPSTSAVGTINYYVSQNVGGCESSRSLIAVTVNAAPATPTVNTPVTYCQNATATVLTASGTSLKWYSVASGGSALASAPTPTTSATGTTNYYVSQTTNGCESARAMIAVTVNAAPSAPTVNTPVTYCQNATAAALTATGTALQWYTSSSGGTGSGSAPTPTTSSTGTTNYYVSQTTNGCESARTMIAVTVNAAPSAPTVTTPVTYCQNATATALTANGTALKWYSVANGGSALASAPIPTTSATGTTNYYVSQTTNGCESARAMIAVTVNAAPSAPIITPPVTYCQNATATALTAAGTSLQWYTASTGGTGSGTAPTPITSATGTTNYYVSQTTNGCESARAMIAVTVNAAPSAPTVTTPVTYCQNATATTLIATGTALQWYTSSTGGTASGTAPTPNTSATGTTNYYVSQTTNGCESARAMIGVTVNALPSAPVVNSPVAYCQNATATALSAIGTALQWYTTSSGGTGTSTAPTPLTTTIGTTNFYVSQTTNGCESARAMIAVNINAAATASISTGGSTAFCQGGSVILTANQGSSYIWFNGSTQVGTNSTYTANTSGSYTVQVTNPSGCTGQVTSSATIVTVNPLPTSPTVSSPVTYCQNASSTALTANGTALQWYSASIGGVALASAPTPATGATGTTNYYVSQTINGCESARAMISVTVNPVPSVPTITSPVTYCQNATATALSATGTGLQWYLVATGGSALASAPTPATSTTGNTNYFVSQTTNGCESARAMISVTVNAVPSAPTVTSPVTYCQNDPATALTATGTALKWFTDANGGIALPSIPTPSTISSGTTNFYVSQTTNGCESARAMVAIFVNPLPPATISVNGNTTIVDGQTVTMNANTGIGLTYKWFNGTTQIGNGASYTTSNAGNYTVQVTNTYGCSSVSPVTTITVTPNQPSVITITSLTDNSNVHAPVTISANITDPDGAIVLVEFLDGNTVIGSTTTQPYSFTWPDPSTGTHTISVRATDVYGGITTSVPITVTVDLSAGIQNAANTLYGEVYPIPARNEITIETKSDLSGAVFTLVNAIGEEVVLNEINIGGSSAKLNVSGLAEGVYILMVKQNSNILTRKIIVAP